MVYLISYDLNKVGKDYTGLIAAIKAIAPTNWHKPLLSVWLVDTSLSATQVYNRLSSHIDADDRILVIRLRPEYSGWLTKADWAWLASSARTY